MINLQDFTQKANHVPLIESYMKRRRSNLQDFAFVNQAFYKHGASNIYFNSQNEMHTSGSVEQV